MLKAFSQSKNHARICTVNRKAIGNSFTNVIRFPIISANMTKDDKKPNAEKRIA